MPKRVILDVAPWGRSLPELVEAGVRAEAAGADTLWVSELHRSATVALAALATRTSTSRIGAGIQLAFVRSPLITALEALDIDELADGRMILGLGSGVQRLNEDWHNARWGKPVGHLRETIRNIRAVVSQSHLGERISLEGQWEPIDIRGFRRPHPPRRSAIPLYLAAVGPQMTRLAGEVADGWIAHELGSPDYLRSEILPSLLDGTTRAGRSREDVQVVASVVCVPHADAAHARRLAATTVAFYASVRTYLPFFEWHGFGDEARAVRAAFVAGDEKGMIAAVPDPMVDRLTVAGTPDEVRSTIGRYDGLADRVKLSPPAYFLGDDVIAEVQEAIIDLVAGT